MRYCVKCGREVDAGEYVSRYGLCIDCFLKYRGIFVKNPVLHITVCPRCGSWRMSGEWYKPAPLNEIIRRVFLNEYRRFADDVVEILDVDVTGQSVRVYKNRYRVEAKALLLFNGVVEKKIVFTLEYVLEKTPCPKCLALAGKSHKALVQIRSEKGRLGDHEKKLIEKILSESSISSDIIEVSENRYGLDVKFYTLNVAKRTVNIIARSTGAKVIESFKPTKYDPRRGSWKGIVTLSVRLPSIKSGDLVEYMNRPAIVREVDSNGINIELLDDGSTIHVDYNSYWEGILKKPGHLFYMKSYRVIAHDSSTLYLLDEETGDMREFPRNNYTRGFNEGDIVYIVKFKNKEYLVKK